MSSAYIRKLLKAFKQLMLVLVVLCICFAGVKVQEKKHKPGWYMSKKGRVYYYDENGDKVTKKNMQIGKKYYYFDEKGMQHVGWIKYKGRYYYYNIAPKKKGYRVCSKTINGIKLDSKGRAVNNKDKARILAEANTIVFSITNFKMNQKKKNRACFMYIRDKMQWRNLTGFKSVKNWDRYYASYAILKGYGDCYSGGCGFAYLATAAGAKKVYAASSGGHGWAVIGDRYYDPNWSWISKSVDKCFAVPKSRCGYGGTPNWAKNGKYINRVD